VTETLELIPRQWKVIQHVREKFGQHPVKTAVAVLSLVKSAALLVFLS
jgi:sulfur relay (sulfurtransferase) DsrC/TusE family protein